MKQKAGPGQRNRTLEGLGRTHAFKPEISDKRPPSRRGVDKRLLSFAGMSETLPYLAHCRGLTDPQAPRPVLRPAAYRQWPPGLPVASGKQ